MICYSCENVYESHELSDYALKIGGQVDICLVCENTYEYYLNVIKRECLIDGESYDLSREDERQIKRERKLRLEKEEEEKQLDGEKSIFYFSNEPLRNVEYDYQALRYINEFLGTEEMEEDHIQRFKFRTVIGKHWHLAEWDGLTNVNVYLDTMSKEYQKVKKPGDTQWRDRVRKWYSGRFECDESLYNATFGFSQHDDEPFGDVWVNYGFICSKSYRVKKLVEDLREEWKR